MRYPSAHDSRIVFVAHGELWLAPSVGGQAHRLVEDEGEAIAPRFSPDGRWIAFTSRRGGRQDLYVVSSTGGEPRRLTFDGSRRASDALVLDWTPDSSRIVFLSSRKTIANKMRRAFSVSVVGGAPEALPLDEAGPLSFSHDGRTIAFNRIYRNDELRKRYVGGDAQNLFTYDFSKKKLERLTQWKGTDTDPMWYGRKVYFLSNRGAHFRSNIWVCDLVTKAVRPVTHFDDLDVDSPSLSDGVITFQQGGKLYAVDLPSERIREISVSVPDDGSRTAPRTIPVGPSARVTDVAHRVDYALSPDGHDALFSARGDIFRVSENGDAVDLTPTSGVDEQHPAWSPDGRFVAYQTDVTGEQQIAIRPVGGGPERVLTNFSTGAFYTPVWSPNGQSLVVPSANHELWWIGLDGAKPRKIDSDPADEIRDAHFSPDGAWLAYSTERSTRLRAIHLVELATGKNSVISSPMESDRNPVFSSDGRNLYFISQRNEFPFVSDRDDQAIVSAIKSDGLYVTSLAVDRREAAGAGGTSAATSPTRQAQLIPFVQVDLDGLMVRATRLPVEPAEIATLEVRANQLFYETQPPEMINGDMPGEVSAMHALNLDTHVDRRITEGIANHSLSEDGSTVLYRHEGKWHLASTSTAGTNDRVLDLSKMVATIDPRQEWREMFENAWRLDRDLFFSSTMNGSDWHAVHRAYERYLPLLGSQDDFLYLLGEMQGEIGSSHTYIDRGPTSDVRANARTPLLGADIAFDSVSGQYRIERILAGDATRERYRSPLNQPGIDISDGDYLLAVDGRVLTGSKDPMSAFVGSANPIHLMVSSTPGGASRVVDVEPISDETDLRQKEWVDRNRQRVDSLSGGAIGYIFVADFEAAGSEDFLRQFYPQLDKKGLVIDVRWNDGGFTSQAVLNVLRRRLAGSFINREGAIEPLPEFTAPLAMATLMNQSSGSDGDQFPHFFRAMGLGPLVGTRTWGGVQGIKGPWRLIDGTGITIPKDSLASIDGHWLIENEGVRPDIAVDNEPDAIISQRDAQLDVAVKAVASLIRAAPRTRTQVPAASPSYPRLGNVPGADFGGRY